MTDKPPVLVVSDDPQQLEFLVRAIKVYGYPVETATSGQDAVSHMERRNTGVVVAEMFLKGINGIELLKSAQRLAPSTQTILIGRDVPTATVVSAMKQGAFDFVEKPLDVDYLLLLIEKAAGVHRLTQENQALKRITARHPRGMVAASSKMREVLETVALVAPTELTVLIEGESGVGKELVANRIHKLSERSDRPFVAVNCGAIQESLLESELFGHEKGAFTGATKEHDGLFTVADNGTLFLDEIGEMSLDLQVKLLRVLERSEFRRVGGNKVLKVNVRVVAATNKRLSEEAQKGTFREDLYYRLNVIHVEVPPLRERLEDIPSLVRAFLDSHRRKGLPQRTISEESMQALAGYGWPGNVRELRNVIERCMILARSQEIQPSDLPSAITRAQPAASEEAEQTSADYDVDLPLADVERQHILRVLDAHEGNKVRTAKALGINVKTLYNKLKSYEQQGS